MKKIVIIISIIIGFLLVIGVGFFIYIKTAFLDKQEIQDIILKDTDKPSDEIYFEKIDLEIKDKVYEVELYYNNIDYEYKIDAKNGRIIYTDFVKNENTTTDDQVTTNDETITNNQNNSTRTKTIEEAKALALEHANVKQENATFSKTQNDVEDGMNVYEIEFTDGNYKYDYEIATNTGEILKNTREKINKQ